MQKSKAILISIDGLGDHTVPELENLTPLEAACCPNLDKLAEEGIIGQVDPYSPGIPCGTDMGHLCMLGYDESDYPGRGPIEALGVGIDMSEDDIAFRCNFATIDEENIVIDRRAGRICEGASELATALTDMDLSNGVKVIFKQATDHRAVLVLRGVGLSVEVSDTDPKDSGKAMGVAQAKVKTDAAECTASVVNEFIEKAKVILHNHPINEERRKKGLLPANAIITRSCGKMNIIESLAARYKNLRGIAVSGEKTVLAVAKMAGFDWAESEKLTGSYNFDAEFKAKLALKCLKTHDLVLLHVKATDLAGHDGLWEMKKRMIEKIDTMVGILRSNIGNDCYLAVTSDHSTPCRIGEHTGDPVPALIWGVGVRADAQVSFGERASAVGGLGRLTGNQFFAILMDLIGFSTKMGA